MAIADNPLRMGILGAAAIAPAAVIRPARHIPGIAITAIAAREPARARAFAAKHRIATVHETYDDLLADPDIDAVYIPLPNGLHGTWTTRAITAGKHVLCEKPFTANAAEAVAVAAAATASDRVVMEAFHWRYHPLVERVLHHATTDLGTIRHVDAAFAFPLLKRHDIRWRRDLAGGGLLDAGCYAVHQVRTVGQAAIGGEPSVRTARATLTRGGVDRALRAELAFPNGATAGVRCGLLDPRGPVAVHLRIDGTRGSLLFRNPVLPHLLGHVRLRLDGRRSWDWAERTPSYRYQLRAFVDAVLHGTTFPTTPTDAVATMRVIDEIQRAAGIVPPAPTR